MKNRYFRASVSAIYAMSLLLQGCSFEDNRETPHPKAGFNTTNDEVYKNEPVTFTNTSSNADAFEWDFGDGTSSSESSPSHTFSSCGKYSVRLTVSANGMTDSASKTISVTSRTAECHTLSAIIEDKQYFPNGKTVNGVKYAYCYKIKVSCSYFGYRQASRWGVIVNSTYHWWEASKDEPHTTLTIEHYTNTAPSRTSKITCRAYVVKTGGDTYGDIFGNTKSINLY